MMSRTKFPAPPSGLSSDVLPMFVRGGSLPRTPRLDKFGGEPVVAFGHFPVGRGNMTSVGKRSDSRPGRAPQSPPAGDIALVFGKNQDGLHILRRRDQNAPIEAGLLQPLVEGRPITGELISMK